MAWLIHLGNLVNSIFQLQATDKPGRLEAETPAHPLPGHQGGALPPHGEISDPAHPHDPEHPADPHHPPETEHHPALEDHHDLAPLLTDDHQLLEDHHDDHHDDDLWDDDHH